MTCPKCQNENSLYKSADGFIVCSVCGAKFTIRKPQAPSDDENVNAAPSSQDGTITKSQVEADTAHLKTTAASRDVSPRKARDIEAEKGGDHMMPQQNQVVFTADTIAESPEDGKVKKKDHVFSKKKKFLLIGLLIILAVGILSSSVLIFYNRVQPIWYRRVSLGDDIEYVTNIMRTPDNTAMNNHYWYKGVNAENAASYLINGKAYSSFMVETLDGKTIRKTYDKDSSVQKIITKKALNVLSFASGQTVDDYSVIYRIETSDGSFEEGYVSASAIITSVAGTYTLTVVTMFGRVDFFYSVM